MTYAPKSVVAVGSLMAIRGFSNLGVVGDAAHVYGYHCGKDRLLGPAGRGWSDYSVQTARDRAGLSDAASAIDLGHTDKTKLRAFSKWLTDQCLAGAPDTRDIREVITSIDGKTVVGWSALAPARLIPGYGDSSHLWHMHISFFRDSETHDLTPLFRRYFGPVATPVAHTLLIAANALVRIATVTPDGRISGWTDRQWGDKASSAPCGAPTVKKGTVAGQATVVLVTAGAFKGQWVRVGDGTSVQ